MPICQKILWYIELIYQFVILKRHYLAPSI